MDILFYVFCVIAVIMMIGGFLSLIAEDWMGALGEKITHRVKQDWGRLPQKTREQ